MDETSSNFGPAALAVATLSLALCLPFLIWRATRRWAIAALILLLLIQAALLQNETARALYALGGGFVLAFLGCLILPGLLLLWRRTRRLGLVLVGTTAVSSLALMDYRAVVISSIGWVLLLIVLWPCWRLLRGAPQGKELRPAIPSRGVLTVRPWPREGGFTLASALVGLFCLTAAFSIAALLIAGTTAALHRADHLAVATHLLASARERALLGADAGDLSGRAGAALPHGQASVQRAPAGPGLTRFTATATWREPDGKRGRAVLEWLALERPR